MAATGTKQQLAPRKKAKPISLAEEGPLQLTSRLPYRPSIPVTRIRAAVRKAIATRMAAQSEAGKLAQ